MSVLQLSYMILAEIRAKGPVFTGTPQERARAQQERAAERERLVHQVTLLQLAQSPFNVCYYRGHGAWSYKNSASRAK